MQLRDYQADAIQKLFASIKGGNLRPVLQSPTGSGKTVIGAELIRLARSKGRRVLFCVPALSLIDQTVERFEKQGITEVGVIQSMHPMTDPRQPIQICSVQTLARRGIPDADLAIIDEAHVMFKLYEDWFNQPEWVNKPIIGLSATPWAKGMGKIWNDLVIGTTTQNLIDFGHLSPFRVFACAHPDLSGVKTLAGDYELKSLGTAMDKPKLVADIVSTWLEKGQNRPTLCFAVNRLHAKAIQARFEQAGVRTGYVDAYTDLLERQSLANKFQNGDITVIVNVGVLTTGVDWDVRCIILARPTKSEILYTQIIGRGLRTAKGKDYCLILDHSDTTLSLGFVTDIHHERLDDGRRNIASKAPVKKPKECPNCKVLLPPKSLTCDACGHEIKLKSNIYSLPGELQELDENRRFKPKFVVPEADQELFYRELLTHASVKGWKEGWAYWAFQDKFKTKPSSHWSRKPVDVISPSTMSWITSRNIAQAKSRRRQDRGAA